MMLLALMASAQTVHRMGCIRHAETTGHAHRHAMKRKLGAIHSDWDPAKTYRQLVVLVEFSDTKFKPAHNLEFYDNLFNHFTDDLHEGEERYGRGSVADYFRDQSHGKLNLHFDIVGPYQISATAHSQFGYKETETEEATTMMVNDQAGRDFHPYDWDGDGSVDQILYIYAGPSSLLDEWGYLLPSTYTGISVMTPDGLSIAQASTSAEYWSTVRTFNSGIGTICHEFSHCLGLPDLYPTNGSTDYVVDDWALMDGGNYINYGWCPPNYGPLEQIQLGWIEPIELTSSTSVRDLKPIAEGGDAYLIRHTANEYYLLENRQQRGWDFGLPGKGLVVWHVCYDEDKWMRNSVNNSISQLGLQLVHADNLTYRQWTHYLKANDLQAYDNDMYMNSRYLSTSPYPYVTPFYTNDELSATTSPKTEMYLANSKGQRLLDVKISNITMSADGLISFDFTNNDPSSGIVDAQADAPSSSVWYDLQGRRLSGRPTRKGTYIRQGRKYVVR